LRKRKKEKERKKNICMKKYMSMYDIKIK
jgi:hypothetical protein